MDPFTLFAITLLATFRLVRIVTTDTITEAPREWLLLRFPPDDEHARLHKRKVKLNTGTVVAWAPNNLLGPRKISKLGTLISCPWCVGFWMSGLVVAVVANLVVVPLPLLWWFAVSAAVGLIARNLDG